MRDNFTPIINQEEFYSLYRKAGFEDVAVRTYLWHMFSEYTDKTKRSAEVILEVYNEGLRVKSLNK